MAGRGRPPADRVKTAFRAYRELSPAEKQRFHDALELVADDKSGPSSKSKTKEAEQAE